MSTPLDKDNIVDGNDDTNTVVYPRYTCVDEDDIDVVGGSDDTNTVVFPVCTSVDGYDVVDGSNGATAM